jgi:competence protein ComEC
MLILVAALIAGGWRLHSGASPLAAPNGLRITFLDVGQGDGVLLQASGGAVLVDEGPPEADVAGQLRKMGVRDLSLVVLTHPQRDHVGGAAKVLERLRVGVVLDPAVPSESPEERSALDAARQRDVRVVVARAGQGYRIGRLRLRILWPTGPGTPGDDPNNHAIVILASYGEVDALMTADAESNVTGGLRVPPAEILKVAHHGSGDPGLPSLLDRLRPRIAVISVGEHNGYGHPDPGTLAALESAPELDLYRTDRDGRVVVESDGEHITVRTDR